MTDVASKGTPSTGDGRTGGRKPKRYEVTYEKAEGGAWMHLPWSGKKALPKLKANPAPPVKPKKTGGWF